MKSYDAVPKSDVDSSCSVDIKEKCAFFNFLYNPQTREILGRTPLSWGQISLFYVIYYIVLFGFAFGMMNIFLQCIISNEQPFLTGENSLLKLSPGIGFRPLPDHKSTLIRFSHRDPQSYQAYVMDLEAFMDDYYRNDAKNSDLFANCPINGLRDSEEVNKLCKFDTSILEGCSRKNQFGYSTGSPCVLLKLNKIFGWIPSLQSDGDNKYPHPAIRCEGMNPSDQENLGPLEYFPSSDDKKSGLFNHHFYPYLAQTSYLSPLVAVRFNNITRHTVVMVECNLVNVNVYRENRPAHFEFLID